MMADNVEHVVNYWVVFQKFHSPALGGFTVVSHWLPYLLFSVGVGGETIASTRGASSDRRGALRARLGRMGLSLPHGQAARVAGDGAARLARVRQRPLGHVQPGAPLPDVVGPAALPSAVRFGGHRAVPRRARGARRGERPHHAHAGADARHLPRHDVLPAAHSVAGERLVRPSHFRRDRPPPKRAVRGLADIVRAAREVRGMPVLAVVIGLAAQPFWIGNSYQAADAGLRPRTWGTAIRALRTRCLPPPPNAASTSSAGILLESRGSIFPAMRHAVGRRAPATAVGRVAPGLRGDALVSVGAIALLFFAGFFELSFSSMTQTLVQMNAPEASRNPPRARPLHHGSFRPTGVQRRDRRAGRAS